MKIHSIIFDLGGVLLNIDYHRTIKAFKLLGIKESNDFYSKKHQHNLFNLLETGNISEPEFLSKMHDLSNCSDKDAIIKAWNSLILELPQNRISMLNNLKKSFNLYLLSNTNSIHIDYIKNKLGKEKYNNFYSIFNKVYYSHKIGVRKPNPKAFELILEEQNLTPNKTLFIDDSKQHIIAAKRLGIISHHLKHNVTKLFPDIIQ